jgi:enoyl-CoA hydratase/carnithine racemase
MDFRLASESARIGFVFSRRGIAPEATSSWFLPRLVGIGQALEWCYSGRVFDAAEALRGGLVRSVHAPDDLLPAARALARELTGETSAVSVSLLRRMLYTGMGAAHPMEAHRLESRAIWSRGASADAREGVASFLEKRPAVFPDSVTEAWETFAPWFDTPDYN